MLNKIKMSDKLYDYLKEFAIVYFPAIITLYGTLSSVWGWPYGEEIMATLGGIGVCLGTCLHISSTNYYKVDCENGKVDKPNRKA